MVGEAVAQWRNGQEPVRPGPAAAGTHEGWSVPEIGLDPRRRGWTAAVGAGIWLVYLLPTMADAIHLRDPIRRAVAVTSLCVFCVMYVWSFAAIRRWRRYGRWISRRVSVAMAVAMIAITAVVIASVGESGLGLFIYLGVFGFFLTSSRLGIVGVAALMLLSVALPAVVPGWKPQPQLIFQIFISAIAMWGVLRLIERNSQLASAREQLAALAVADERNRFARDLHDILGHSLTVVAIKAELAGRLVAADPARAEAEINEVERLARQALRDVRAAVSGYREITLATELAGARSALLTAGIDAELPTAVDAVQGPRRELFGWAVREGVTNVVRHSGATRCWIRLSDGEIEIADNGTGPACADSAEAGGDDRAGQHGLRGLRERAEQAGGTLVVGRAAEGGFSLRVRMS
jgi:two-component system, NarL family, sensor histidine kinase DesK